MEKKLQFVSLAATGRSTFTELCAEFHVSRKTGYKWRERYRREGAAGLRERSRRPHGCSHHTVARIEQLILRERGKYRSRASHARRRERRPCGRTAEAEAVLADVPVGT